MFVFLGLTYIEVQAKVREFGWNVQNSPLELTFLTDSPDGALFFVLFIIPIFGAFALAAARHSERDVS